MHIFLIYFLIALWSQLVTCCYWCCELSCSEADAAKLEFGGSDMQRARFLMRYTTWSIFGEALVKKSPAPLGKQLMLQRQVLGEGSSRPEVTADLP